MHSMCGYCSMPYYAFDNNKPCQGHPGILVGDPKRKTQWSCCDKLMNEAGCTQFFHHACLTPK